MSRSSMNVNGMNNALAGCVASLQDSNRLLESSIAILDSGVHDFPRMKKVLQTTRHFELISEPTLFAAQSSLADEIGPEVEHLLRRVEAHLAKLERREKGLIAKSELYEGRLQQKPAPLSSLSLSAFRGGAGVGGSAEAVERLKLLRNKRERLEHTIERLQLQTQHKERQLRMNTAYGGTL